MVYQAFSESTVEFGYNEFYGTICIAVTLEIIFELRKYARKKYHFYVNSPGFVSAPLKKFFLFIEYIGPCYSRF